MVNAALGDARGEPWIRAYRLTIAHRLLENQL